MSLRARLLATLLILAATGLAVADVATYSALRRFMVGRVDDQLRDSRGALSGFGPFRGSGLIGVYAELRNQAGDEQGSSPYRPPGEGPDSPGAPDPQLPAQLPGSGAPGYDTYFNAPAESGSLTYRVLATQVRLDAGTTGTLIVAMPLTDVISTLHRLVLLMLVVGVVVLLAIAGVGLWRVRAGLKPLEQMGETAGAIAAGDLTRRIENTDERTEVGRLGIALNAMLAQIEAAFEQRRRSENRLRRFVADASHELRTPLTSIRGYAELFRRGAADRPEDLAKAMGRIEAEASRMGILVEDLLLLARMDEGRPMEREPVDLSVLLRDAVDDARAAAPDLEVAITASEPVVVPGDPVRLRQVIDNLLDNAYTHTPAGTHVRASVVSTADEAVVTVEDDGPGLPPEEEGKVFERFYRADPSRSHDKGGSGLGLSISSAIAEGHGGALTVGPSSEGGARFELRLPRHPVDPEPVPASDDAEMPPPPEP